MWLKTNNAHNIIQDDYICIYIYKRVLACSPASCLFCLDVDPMGIRPTSDQNESVQPYMTKFIEYISNYVVL